MSSCVSWIATQKPLTLHGGSGTDDCGLRDAADRRLHWRGSRRKWSPASCCRMWSSPSNRWCIRACGYLIFPMKSSYRGGQHGGHLRNRSGYLSHLDLGRGLPAEAPAHTPPPTPRQPGSSRCWPPSLRKASSTHHRNPLTSSPRICRSWSCDKSARASIPSMGSSVCSANRDNAASRDRTRPDVHRPCRPCP